MLLISLICERKLEIKTEKSNYSFRVTKLCCKAETRQIK